MSMRLMRPRDVDDVVRLLDESEEDAKVVAGATAVMVMIRNGLISPQCLVAVDSVPGLDYLACEDTQVRIGALTSLRWLERSAELRTALPTLAQTIGLVANHRVRARATIGGNLSEADYASDPPAVLSTLGCRVRIAGPAGERVLSLSDFLVSYYETVLAHNEFLTEVIVDRPPPTARTTYLKYVSRAAEDRPCVGIAAYLDSDEAGLCRTVRVAVAAATATPFVLPEVTEACRGKAADESLCAEVAEAYRQAIQPIEDGRGSSAYRKHVTGKLVYRALRGLVAGEPNGAQRL